jgi:hypothetical protein
MNDENKDMKGDSRVLFWHLPRKTEEKHEKTQSG